MMVEVVLLSCQVGLLVVSSFLLPPLFKLQQEHDRGQAQARKNRQIKKTMDKLYIPCVWGLFLACLFVNIFVSRLNLFVFEHDIVCEQSVSKHVVFGCVFV